MKQTANADINKPIDQGYRHSSQGFTLLEVLVALSVFSILAIMAYSGLKNVLDTAQHIEVTAQQTARLQWAFSRLEQDISQLIQRPVRDAFGDELAAVQGRAQEIVFTRNGWQNPLQRSRSHLQRVAWLLEEDTLYRRYWLTLDGAQDADWRQTPILEAVESLTVRYLDAEQQWHTEWPPYVARGVPNDATLKAVEVTIEWLEWGQLRRLWAVAEKFPTPSKIIIP